LSKRKIITVALLGLFICSLLILVPVQPVKAQFVLSVDYPDDNGNGIYYIWAEFDGEFNATVYYNPCHPSYGTATNPLETQVGVNITLAVFCWLNGTWADIASLVEGKNVIRHSVAVSMANGTTIFSQQNFTYITGTDGGSPMYFYRYDVILDFVPEMGQIYTATVTYEVFGVWA